MEIFLPIFLSSIATLILIHYVLKYSYRFNIFVKHKKNYKNKNIVRLGGIAIGLGVLISFLTCSYFLKGDMNSSIIFKMMFGATCFLILGVIDDLVELDAIKRLIIEFLLVYLFIRPDLVINTLAFSTNSIIGYSLTFPNLLAILLTALWIIGFTNAINWIDGIDGLATGVTLILTLQLIFLSIITGNTVIIILLASLLGSCISFLFFNKFPSKIIMGDGGSHFIGFILSTATLVIFSNIGFSDLNNIDSSNYYKNIFYLSPGIIVLLMPVFEMFIVIVNRIRNKFPIIYGDRSHLHYKLIDSGLTEDKTAKLICAGYLFVAGISLLSFSKIISLIYFLVSVPFLSKKIYQIKKFY